jgi:hypothetical protein
MKYSEYQKKNQIVVLKERDIAGKQFIPRRNS